MITSERELQNELVIHLTEQGFNCKQYVPNSVGIADVVIDNAVIELKHLPDREALFKAVGQAVLYRGAIDKNLDAKIICSYSSDISLSILESVSVAVNQVGLELIPWVKYDSLIFQTDHKYNVKNICQVNDVCLISSLCQAKLLKYNSFWGIVLEAYEYFCKVQVFGKTFVIPAQHLKNLAINKPSKADFKAMSDRIRKLVWRNDLDDADDQFLDLLQRRTVWTPRQLLLGRIEQDYGIC